MKDTIDVQQIMADIKNEIKEKGYTSDMLSFKDINGGRLASCEFSLEEFKNIIVSMEDTKIIPWQQNNLGHGLKGFIKKIIRKLVGFVIAPVSDGQNEYNQYVTSAFYQMLGFIEKQDEMIEQHESRINTLLDRIEQLESK